MSARVFTALLLAAAAAGCQPPELQAITTPPPFTQASLVDDGGDARITLTKGVALAFICTDPKTSEPCGDVSGTMADPTIASVMDGYLDTLSPSFPDPSGSGLDGAQSWSPLVVIGLEEGETTLAFSSASGDVSIQVSVVGF